MLRVLPYLYFLCFFFLFCYYRSRPTYPLCFVTSLVYFFLFYLFVEATYPISLSFLSGLAEHSGTNKKETEFKIKITKNKMLNKMENIGKNRIGHI